MGKLHELLAVEGDLKGQAQKRLAAIVSLFRDGAGKFLGQQTTHQPSLENDEQLPAKVSKVATTVFEQLEMLEKPFAKWVDASVQKEITNREAAAVLKVAEKSFILPATALLNLENKLLDLRAIYRVIPTNDVTSSWRFDEDTSQFVSDPPEVRRTTKKVMRSFEASPATKEHPAQVQVYNEDILSGHLTTIKQSGMITPTDKQARLERLDELYQEVKKARQRANDIEVDPFEIGQWIFDFINGE